MTAISEEVEKVCGRHISSITFVKPLCRCGCNNCENIPTYQHTLPCGCEFCDICFKHQDGTSVSGVCSFHKTRCHMTKVKTVQKGINDIINMRVYCRNRINGCNYATAIRNLKNHEDLCCCFKYADCPMKCGDRVLLKDLVNHLSAICSKQVEECRYCRTFMMKHSRDDHHQQCGKFPVACPYCSRELERSKLEAHTEECEERLVPCRFKEVGCTYMEKRSKVVQHEAIERHTDLLLDSFRQLNEIKMETECRREEVQSEMEILKCLIQSLDEKRSASHVDFVDDFKFLLRELKEIKEVALNVMSSCEKWMEVQENTPEGFNNIRRGATPRRLLGSAKAAKAPCNCGICNSQVKSVCQQLMETLKESQERVRNITEEVTPRMEPQLSRPTRRLCKSHALVSKGTETGGEDGNGEQSVDKKPEEQESADTSDTTEK